jgi:hypothetical protein
MTREQVEAKMVEMALVGKAIIPYSLYGALLTAKVYCEHCHHNVSFVKVTYDNDTKYPPKVMRCSCGKLVRLWHKGKFWEPCVRCEKLPEPAEFKSRHDQHDTRTDLEGKPIAGAVYTYKRFVCPCGMTTAQEGEQNRHGKSVFDFP